MRANTAQWIGSLLGMLPVGVSPVLAQPLLPTSDNEIIEVLPMPSLGRAEERRMRRELAQRPRDPTLALTAARRYLAQAHEAGDPRFAGMAVAALAPWTKPSTAPNTVLMMRAQLQQYLHEFAASALTLQQLLARRPFAEESQAWLTLATVRRVQGRYAESDFACQQVLRSGADLFGKACLAENAGLRGEVSDARVAFRRLRASPGASVPTQAWLSTSLAELEQRAGKVRAAETAFRLALQLDADSYTRLAYADFLIDQHRPGFALSLLNTQPRTDAVLLRLAIAGTLVGSPTAAADALEMRSRIELANERPDAKVFHGREQAMFSLFVDHDVARALDLARGNAAAQREPLDLLVFARAAHASGSRSAVEEVRALTAEMGLVDQRLRELQ